MHGLVVVDLKENYSGKPLVTEINIRHIAFTSSFAAAGFNFSEFQLLCMLNRINEISPELVSRFPEDNIILRDVDGLPLYVEHFKELEVGQYF
jgi:carbamoyl-phosphate synthase large subunit